MNNKIKINQLLFIKILIISLIYNTLISNHYLILNQIDKKIKHTISLYLISHDFLYRNYLYKSYLYSITALLSLLFNLYNFYYFLSFVKLFSLLF